MIRNTSEIPVELQRLQDEKGYVVLAVFMGQKKIGDTISVVSTSVGDYQCTTAVIGFSNFEEWASQTSNEVFGNARQHPEDYQYVKVIAE